MLQMAELCGEATISPSKGTQEPRHNRRVELTTDFSPLFRLSGPPQSDFELRGASRALVP
jgi:hypothetical protein